MTYVEVWSEKANQYYVNIITEKKKYVQVEEFANTKDRGIASCVAKHLATTKKLPIEYRINH